MIPEQTRAEMEEGKRMLGYHKLEISLHEKYGVHLRRDVSKSRIRLTYYGVEFSEPYHEFPSQKLLAQLELLRLSNT